MNLDFILSQIERLENKKKEAIYANDFKLLNESIECLLNMYDIAISKDNVNNEKYQETKLSLLNEQKTYNNILIKLNEKVESDFFQNNNIENIIKSINTKPIETKKKNDSETEWKAVKVPDVSFNDVAGLDDVKKSIEEKIILPRKYPDIYKNYKIKSGSGILLYGLPGTGKTMIAKATAHEVNAPFYQVKCSDISSKWVGESERNIKNLFDTARQHKTAVIFFDEFDSIASSRKDDNSASRNSVVNELLTQIQGFNDSDNSTLLLIAATNKPWLIDSALLRPGRFGERICVPLPDKKSRKYLIDMCLKDIPISKNLDIDKIVEYTEGFSGADITEFCTRMKDNPLRKSIASNGKKMFEIQNEDFEYAKIKVKSSITFADMQALEKFENNK